MYVTKTWIVPATDIVTVNLLAEAELTEDNDWQHSFTDLEQYDPGKSSLFFRGG